MVDRCPDCGSNLALVGISHRCTPSSAPCPEPGTRKRVTGKTAGSQRRPHSEAGAPEIARRRGRTRVTSKPSLKRPDGERVSPAAGVEPGPREHRLITAAKEAVAIAKGEIEPVAVHKIKTGRPYVEKRGETLAATKPWVAAGMSRSTWFARRQKEKR
jgi:hypothetical protein